MRWFQSVAREILGLFVDDGAFAIAILLWLTITGLLFPHVAKAAHWTGPAFFAGLAMILIRSVLRYSRQSKK